MFKRKLKYFLDGMAGLRYPYFIPGDKSRVDEAVRKHMERSWKRVGDSMWAALGDAHDDIKRSQK